MKRNLDFVKDILLETAIESVNDLVDEWIQYAQEHSPIYTWEYIAWHKWEYATVDYLTWTVKWRIYNDVEYADEVEEWFEDRWWKKVTWHIKSGNVVDIWAEVYTRTTEHLERVADSIIEFNLLMNNK